MSANAKPLNAMCRYGLLVLLCCASSLSLAREVQMHGANGDGGGDVCPDQAAAHPAVKHPAPASRAKTKLPVSVRGGDSDDIGPHTPRWHSFLPGMFR